jgi:hypothetical protein|tara:strand:- start:242 stop:388 length:147 start_codon:yes stop_codon:yes gene_type:complete
MNIKDLLTPQQYKEQLKEYNEIVKNNEISFFDFCTKTFKIKQILWKNH